MTVFLSWLIDRSYHENLFVVSQGFWVKGYKISITTDGHAPIAQLVEASGSSTLCHGVDFHPCLRKYVGKWFGCHACHQEVIRCQTGRTIHHIKLIRHKSEVIYAEFQSQRNPQKSKRGISVVSQISCNTQFKLDSMPILASILK